MRVNVFIVILKYLIKKDLKLLHSSLVIFNIMYKTTN